MGGKGLISTADWPSTVDFPADEGGGDLRTAGDQGDGRREEPPEDHKGAEEDPEPVRELRRRRGCISWSCTAAQRAPGGDRGAVIKKYSKTGIKPERVIKLQHELGDELSQRLASLPDFDEFQVLLGATGFLSKEIGMEVRVFKAGEKGCTTRLGRRRARSRSSLPSTSNEADQKDDTGEGTPKATWIGMGLRGPGSSIQNLSLSVGTRSPKFRLERVPTPDRRARRHGFLLCVRRDDEGPFPRDIPVVIGADPKDGKGRGVVVSCNYPREVRVEVCHAHLRGAGGSAPRRSTSVRTLSITSRSPARSCRSSGGGSGTLSR